MLKFILSTNLIDIKKQKAISRLLLRIPLILLGFIIIPSIINAQCNEKLSLTDGTHFNLSDLSASVDDNIYEGIFSLCLGNVSHANRLIDDDPSNYATVSITAGLACNGMLSVSHAGDFPAGSFAGFEVGAAGLADVSVFPRITIRTYLNGALQESHVAVDDVLGLDANLITGNGHMILGFITSQNFDKISIEYKTLLGVLFHGNVYHAVIEEFCPGPALDCNEQTSWTNPDYPLVVSSANTGVSGLLGGVTCLLCGVGGAENILTASQTDFASLNLDVAVGAKASLSVIDVLDTYAAGTFAGFEISDAGLVTADVLSGLAINTYLDGVLQETAASSESLVSVGSSLLGSPGKRVLGFPTTLPFDELQIEKTNLAGALSTTKVYQAILQDFCPATIACDSTYYVSNPDFPVIIDPLDTRLGGLVSLGCSIDNAQNVINEDETDYATITLVAGVGNSGSISVKNVLQNFPDISYAGFVIEKVDGLLRLELFNSITICTYLDDNMQECATGAELLDLNVLNLIDSGTDTNPDVYNVGFQTSLPYNEVKIMASSLVSLLNRIKVYAMYLDTNAAYGAGLDCIDTNGALSIDDIINTPYEHPTIGNLSTNDLGFNQSIYVAHPIPSTEGTVNLNTDGTYTFRPVNGFSGETSFTYQSCYTNLPFICDTATVYIEVFPPVNTEGQAPIANPDAIQIKEDTFSVGNVLINNFDIDSTALVVSDINIGEILGGSAVGLPHIVAGIDVDGIAKPNAATITLNADGSYKVMPVLGFVGSMEAEYVIMDEDGKTDTASLIIKVVPNGMNDIFAEDDAFVVDAGMPLSGNVIDNDFDPEGNNMVIARFDANTDNDKEIDEIGNVEEPTLLSGMDKFGNMVEGAGLFMIDSLGNFTFEPLDGFTGNIIVPYKVCDDTLHQDFARATLSISVLEMYRDYGDAPSKYPSAWHRAMSDENEDNILDGTSDVWLGKETTFESFERNTATADADNDDSIIQEKTLPQRMAANTQYDVDIIVNSTAPDVVHYGLWIDYDEDGIYDQFYAGSQETPGARTPTAARIPITTPEGLGSKGQITINTRLRVDDNPLVANDFQGGKINGEVEDYQSEVALSLPVEMNYFMARNEDCTVHLEWATASEQNNDYFVVEYSTDGVEFEAIGMVDGQGNTSKQTEYGYTHKNMSQGNSYYRLKQVDFDKRYEYSQTASADVQCANLNVRIYPNPMKNRLMIELSDAIITNETLNVTVRDVYGETILDKSFENCQPGTVLKLSLENYPPGIYFVKSSQENIFTETYKIFKR